MIAFAAYDGIRVVRRIFPHGIFMISLEDLVYWLVISLCFFLHLTQVNNGKIRGYVLLGSLLGAWIYYSFWQSVCYAVSDGKDSLSEKEVEKVPGNDYNKVK